MADAMKGLDNVSESWLKGVRATTGSLFSPRRRSLRRVVPTPMRAAVQSGLCCQCCADTKASSLNRCLSGSGGDEDSSASCIPARAIGDVTTDAVAVQAHICV